MVSEGAISLSVGDDVLKHHGTRMSDIDLASRKEEEAASRRYEAAAWLRGIVGVVGARDLAQEPTEEEFRLGLRNGIVLCNALNKVRADSVHKVVEAPADPLPDGTVLSAFQYFENVRNFLDAMEGLGLPTFEASDLERGGKGSRVVNSVLALKSYQNGGIVKPSSNGKCFYRRNSGPIKNSLARSQSMPDGAFVELNFSVDFLFESIEMTTSPSLDMIVRDILSDKKPEEIPMVVESMLTKLMQEFEHRIASQKEMVKTISKDQKVETRSFCEASNSLEVQSDQSNHCDNKVKTISRDRKEETRSLCEASNSSEVRSDKSNRCENKVNVTLEDLREEETSSNGEASNSTVVQVQSNQFDCFENNMVQSDNSFSFSRDEDFRKILKDQKKAAKEKLLKQCVLVDKQNREIQDLKDALVTTRASVESIRSEYSSEFSNLGKHMQILAHAASGYRRVLEENRKLYNQVQDLKGNIRVYCRVRPFLPGKSSNLNTTVGHLDEGNITIITPSKYGKDGHKSFSFNRVFGPSATQAEVFIDTQPLIRSILDGYNVCIFAYGQTGSGKTHTMSGPNELTEETYGVNYRALNDLFQISRERKDTICYEISVQMIEIYNEQVRDLLNSDGPQKRLDIRNNSQKGLAVPDANLVPVQSTAEVIELMNIGQKNRAVSFTAMNDRSSRSHSCLTIHVQGKELTSGVLLRGCLHLVDLAGSERVNKSDVKGDRLKEAQHINKSLAALGDVISALAQKSSHVPYRNSKLTQLLQDSLGGQAKTLMFIHISPEADALTETLSTLKFAERVATIELGAAHANKENVEARELRQQIANLKAALAGKEGDQLSSTLSSPDTYGMASPTEQNQMQIMEDFGNSEETADILTTSDSSAWQERFGKKKMGSGDWDDKIMLHKDEVAINDDDENLNVQDSAFHGYIPDMRVLGHNHTRAHSFTTDDSDDLDFAMSDSSEQDSHPKSSSSINGGSGSKRSQLGTKTPEKKTPNRTHAPSPSKKISNAPPSQTVKSSPKPNVSTTGIDGKRKQNGKVTSAK